MSSGTDFDLISCYMVSAADDGVSVRFVSPCQTQTTKYIGKKQVANVYFFIYVYHHISLKPNIIWVLSSLSCSTLMRMEISYDIVLQFFTSLTFQAEISPVQFLKLSLHFLRPFFSFLI